MFQNRDQFTPQQWATIRELCLHERPRPLRQDRPRGSAEFIDIHDDLTIASIEVHPDGTATKSELNGIVEGWTEAMLDQSKMEWIDL